MNSRTTAAEGLLTDIEAHGHQLAIDKRFKPQRLSHPLYRNG